MTYEILSRTTTITTLVQYNFDGVLVNVNVPHFEPQDEAAIIQGIENRAISEELALAEQGV